MTDPFAALDQAVADLKAAWPKPVPVPVPAPPPTPQPTSFPGDPGPGKLILGAATDGNGDPGPLEQLGGKKLARRRYWNGGIADFAVPNGPIARAILEDHAAGRIPVPSGKPGIADTAAGRYDAQLQTFFAWCLKQPKDIVVFVHHEPENDQVKQPAAVQHQLAADFRGCQQKVRAALTAATSASGKPNRTVAFGGSLMTYSLSAQGKAKFAPIDEFYPGTGVWDFVGWDHYNEIPANPLEDAVWAEAVVTTKRWGGRLAVAELGVRPEDPAGAAKLKAFYERLISLDAAFCLYYDSAVNSSGTGWKLGGATRDAWAALMKDPRSVNPNG
jgi:hypothetical protein